MGTNKAYDGYKSYQYLQKNADYKAFELVKEVGRVPVYVVPVRRPRRSGPSGFSLIVWSYPFTIIPPSCPRTSPRSGRTNPKGERSQATRA